MGYPVVPSRKLLENIELYAQLKHEYGAKSIQPKLNALDHAIKTALAQLKALPINKKLAHQEPNSLEAIQQLRPAGQRIMWKEFDVRTYRERLAGAFIGRMAGCTLGAPVEFWGLKEMEDFAKLTREKYPMRDYWRKTAFPFRKRYEMSYYPEYSRNGMNGVPVDDDIIYTLLGLLVVEEHGPNFTVADVGASWLKHLDIACTAERVALDNLIKKIPARKAGEYENPYCEWIGADIRSDPWGYMAPAWPEKAAEMAYHDAYLSHRRNGIYGEMYFSAVIAAAFALDNPVEALHAGLAEIPAQCNTAKAVRWALKEGRHVKNYREARAAVDAKFKGMSGVHTIINAPLTIFGIMIGKRNFTRVIGETVAMGLDNDCTAATAGSIVGAVIGIDNIPRHWYRGFNNTVKSYMKGRKPFKINDVLRRFEQQAKRVYGVKD